MGSKKTIIIASVIISLLLLTILFMDYRIRNLEGKTGVDETPLEVTEPEETIIETDPETEVSEETPEETESDETVSTNLGTLDIVSYPEGAAVYINGSKVGTAPYKNFSVPAGQYDIKLMKADYGDYCKTVEVFKSKIRKVTGLMTNQSVGCDVASTDDDDEDEETDTDDEEEDVSETGTKITSEPSGAEVKISGQVKGTTPMTIEFTEGTTLLKITKSGYKTYSAFINIGSDGYISSVDSDSEQNGNYTKEDDDEFMFYIDE